MPSLNDVLASVPGYGGYLAKRQMNEQQDMQQLQQAGSLIGLQNAIQSQQEDAQLKAVMAQAGGDPAKAVEALLKAGTPKSIALASHLKGMLPKPVDTRVVAPGASLYDKDNNLILTAPEKTQKPEPPRMRNRFDGETVIQEELKPDGTWGEIGRGPRFGKQVVGITDPSKEPLSDAAIKDLAIQSLYDPNSLSGYRRDTAAMSRIGNARVKLMQESGVTSEDVVSGRAGFKADTMSLNKITPQYDAITAFEKTALRNGKVLNDLATKADATGLPVIERWIRAGRQGTGDPDVAAFNTQMNVYRAEVARILTQPNLGGQLTDTARREVAEGLANNASASQIKKVTEILERDFTNRRQTLEEQIASIRARMRGRVSPSGASETTPAPMPASTMGAIPEFATEADMDAALKGGRIKRGDKVKVGGRQGTAQ